MLTVSYITAPRPVETLSRSFESTVRAGLTDNPIWIFADGYSVRLNTTEQNSPNIVRVDYKNGLRNWLNSARVLLSVTNSRYFLFLEDDVLWAQGAAEALKREFEGLKQLGYYSLYTSNAVDKCLGGGLKPGIYEMTDWRKCLGSQAYFMPRESVEMVLADQEVIVAEGVTNKMKYMDQVVSKSLIRGGKKCWYRVPCLVSHELGDLNSTLRDDEYCAIQSRYWTGLS